MREFFVLEGTKVKVDKGTITWSIYSFPASLLGALQTGRMVSISFLFPISLTLEHHHADTLLALVIKSTVIRVKRTSNNYTVIFREL